MEEEKKENGGEPESKVEDKYIFIDRNNVSNKAEIRQDRSIDINKINLPEMILNATDRLLEDKKSIESKATGYLAFAALILAILAQLFPNIVKATKESCPLFSNLSFIFFVLTFVTGISLVIICAIILCPRQISYFSPTTLTKLYRDSTSKKSYTKIDEHLIGGNEKSIPVNVATLKKMRVLSKTASIFLMILINIFIFDMIFYFVFLGE